MLRALFSSGWSLEPQGEGSLGERMARAVSAAFAEGAARAIVVGSDAPSVTGEDVAAAFEALTGGVDVVLAPSGDGGYSLVGMRAGVAPERVFEDVRWSTEHTAADTVSAARRAGLSCRELPERPDLDVAADVAVLLAHLGGRDGAAPETLRALRRHLAGRAA